MTAEDNLLLLQRIDADRQFLLLAMQSNPALREGAEAWVRELFAAVPPPSTSERNAS